MSDLTKNAAYIKGLLDGMKLDTAKDETKLFNAIIDFLTQMADKVDMIEQEQDILSDEINDIDEVLEAIEDELIDFDDSDAYQIKCDSCGNDVQFTEDDIEELVSDGIECPYCGELVSIDLSDIDDDCGCGCGCEHDSE